MKKLLLLGVWDTTPAGSWQFMSVKMIQHFKNLTGFRLNYLNIREKDLNKECFLRSDADKLFKYFDNLTEVKKNSFINLIVNDFYKHSKQAAYFVDELESIDFAKKTKEELEIILEQWCDIMPLITMQIWFAVLIDVWYPDPKYLPGIKKQLGKARDHSGKLQSRIYKLAWAIYREAAKRLKIPFKQLLCVTPPELIKILKKPPKRLSFKERTKLSVYAAVGNNFKILSGKKAKQFLEHYEELSSADKKVKELNDTPASPGKARGKVRIVLYNNDFNNFKKGEILASYQTMVHFVPIMKKASAVITEFGGLTSHAAIVSRELKKPCIVGINNLIKSVKTGDMVEVDATKGVVCKI